VSRMMGVSQQCDVLVEKLTIRIDALPTMNVKLHYLGISRENQLFIPNRRQY